MAFLEDWDLSFDEINELLTANPSLRSFVMGYAAEIKCRSNYLLDNPNISNVYKPDDHDRTQKGDWVITYKGERISIEVKSLQSNSIKQAPAGIARAVYQCDASDSRTVFFSDGTQVKTTALLVGEFDVVAVNVHSFSGKWEFAWALNQDLLTMESSSHKSAKAYTDFQKSNLIKTTQPITAEIAYPYTRHPEELFERVLEERRRAKPVMQAALDQS